MLRSHLFIWTGLLTPLLLSFSSCSQAPDFWAEATPGKKRILVTFPPLYCIAHAVAGDDAYVLCLLNTQGPHDYDGAATDILKVNGADLLVYNGLTLDDLFADKMLRNNRNARLTVLNVGKTLDRLDATMDEKDKRIIRGKPIVHEDHVHGAEDPHYWLGPEQALAMTSIIEARLIEIDAAHEKGYRDRAGKFIAELKELQKHGAEALKQKKNKKIVTMHEAFAYFAKGFGIEIAAVIQQRPGLDPDAANMARLIETCQKENVRVIAVEPQYKQSQAESLRSSLKAKGLDVKIITLDPLETAPAQNAATGNPDPGYYLKKMRENIDTLSRALP